jgi:hypothetical protein
MVDLLRILNGSNPRIPVDGSVNDVPGRTELFVVRNPIGNSVDLCGRLSRVATPEMTAVPRTAEVDGEAARLKRADWMKAKLAELGWTTNHLATQSGVKPVTQKKLLAGNVVRNDVLEAFKPEMLLTLLF